MENPDSRAGRTALIEVALLFLKLGTISFGGPAAHIALMEDEVVRRRSWLSRERFLDYVGATNLIPGPNSTELAMQIGRERAGWWGLVVAGVAFIVPATIIVGFLAWGYARFGQLPEVGAALAGVKPVVIVIVLQALWRLGRTALTSAPLVGLALAATAAAITGVHELLVLLGAATLAGGAAGLRRSDTAAPNERLSVASPVAGAALVAATLGAPATAQGAASPWPLFGVFVKIGSVLFGSGYVLLAFLRADLVERLRWLTEQQLLDAIAVGQITPGPVFTTATFVGYILAGIPGATAATVGIFLPAFIFVAVSGPLIPRIRRSRIASAALDGVNTASLALMAVVTWQLGRTALVDLPTVLIAVIAGGLLLTRRVGSAWLIAGGALAGTFGVGVE